MSVNFAQLIGRFPPFPLYTTAGLGGGLGAGYVAREIGKAMHLSDAEIGPRDSFQPGAGGTPWDREPVQLADKVVLFGLAAGAVLGGVGYATLAPTLLRRASSVLSIGAGTGVVAGSVASTVEFNGARPAQR